MDSIFEKTEAPEEKLKTFLDEIEQTVQHSLDLAAQHNLKTNWITRFENIFMVASMLEDKVFLDDQEKSQRVKDCIEAITRRAMEIGRLITPETADEITAQGKKELMGMIKELRAKLN